MKRNLFSDNVYFEEKDATSNVPARVPSRYHATPLVDRYQVGRRYVCFLILAYSGVFTSIKAHHFARLLRGTVLILAAGTPKLDQLAGTWNYERLSPYFISYIGFLGCQRLK